MSKKFLYNINGELKVNDSIIENFPIDLLKKINTKGNKDAKKLTKLKKKKKKEEQLKKDVAECQRLNDAKRMNDASGNDYSNCEKIKKEYDMCDVLNCDIYKGKDSVNWATGCRDGGWPEVSFLRFRHEQNEQNEQNDFFLNKEIPDDFMDRIIKTGRKGGEEYERPDNFMYKTIDLEKWISDYLNDSENKCDKKSNDIFMNNDSECPTYDECEKEYIMELNVQAKKLVASKRIKKEKKTVHGKTNWRWQYEPGFGLDTVSNSNNNSSSACLFADPRFVFAPAYIYSKWFNDWEAYTYDRSSLKGNHITIPLFKVFYEYLKSKWSIREEIHNANKNIIIERRIKRSEELGKLYNDKIDLILSDDNTSESVKTTKLDSLRDEFIQFIENKENKYFNESSKNYFSEELINKVNVIIDNLTKFDAYIFYKRRIHVYSDSGRDPDTGEYEWKVRDPDQYHHNGYPVTKNGKRYQGDERNMNYKIPYHILVYRKVMYEKLVFPLLKGYKGEYFDIRYPNEKYEINEDINQKLEEVKLGILSRIVQEKSNLYLPGNCEFTLVKCDENCERGTGSGIIVSKAPKNNGKKCPTKEELPKCYEGEDRCPYKPVDCKEGYSQCKLINGECKKKKIIYQQPMHNGKQCVLPEYENCQDGEGLCPVNCKGEFSKCADNCTKQFKITREAKNTGSIECDYSDGEIIPCTGDYCIDSVDCVGNWSDCFVDEESGLCKKKWNITTEKKGNGYPCRFSNGQTINCEPRLCNLENNDINNGNTVEEKECKGNFTKCNSKCEKRWILEEEGNVPCNFDVDTVYKCEEGDGECLVSKDCLGRWSSCNENCKSKWELLEKEQGKNGRCDFTNGQEKECLHGEGLCVKSDKIDSDVKSENNNSNTLILIIGILIIIGLLAFNR